MFENIHSDELQKELDRRKEAAKKNGAKPRIMQQPDFRSVMEMAQNYIDDLAANGCADDSYPIYIYEGVITACFGNDVWKWINSRQEKYF